MHGYSLIYRTLLMRVCTICNQESYSNFYYIYPLMAIKGISRPWSRGQSSHFCTHAYAHNDTTQVTKNG